MELDDDTYSWPTGSVNQNVHTWETPQSRGRRSTEADFDMEGPFKPFVPVQDARRGFHARALDTSRVAQ